MASSPVELANLALIQVGEQTINDLEQDADRARAINVLYSNSRDAVLAAHNWNEATKRDALAKLTDTPSWGFTGMFQLPPDYLRFVRIEDMRDQFQIEGDKILANLDTINLIYIFRLEDVTRMSPLLEQAIAARLAADIAVTIRGDEGQAERYYKLFVDKLNEARFVDALQGPVHTYGGTTFFDARFVGPTGFADSIFRPIASG